MSRARIRLLWLAALVSTWVAAETVPAGAGAAEIPPADAARGEAELRQLLDAPLLFTKRHSYQGIHIYDTYYKWPPGGGGIYVIENPSDPRDQWRIRPVIDPDTPETLGVGVYTDPELSWDAKRLLFCFKGEPEGSTSIYEIGVDGRGLRRLTDPTPTCDRYEGSFDGQHDICPAYLPDDRIVFLSTRPSGLVPCFNTGVAILHVMNADGSGIRPISVNNVNEFDPAVLPDGRILFGRWEYVDKNALTIQSLWTVNPDGTQETALYANNMVFPEAVLDARPVPGSHLIVGTFAKHNSTPRGSIALVDPRRGKNLPDAAVNLEHPDDPTFDRGDSCEPWPLSEDVVLFSGRPEGSPRNVLEMIDRGGRRIVVHSDPAICLHSPMLVKPRPRPPVLAAHVDGGARTGRFFVQDVYRGLDGVAPGEVKWLRVIEETSRTSARPQGANPYNQTFLASSALAFGAKSFLGMVPVEEDGSAYFEVPSGRAVYLQALDAEGRLIQSMRTFVQAAPGTTRSCVGCHEHKYGTTVAEAGAPMVFAREPRRLQPESWGTGYLDYPSMIQPILDRHCVRCHGGEEGFAAGMDLSGGWTEHFSISYENLTNRVETQLIAHWIAGIDCMNGTALWSSQIFPPRAHGSGAAPLADLLVSGHDGYVADLTRTERDLLMAWIDTNGLYYGTWDHAPSGCAIGHWQSTRQALTAQMQAAGCLECHGDGNKIAYFENDWINLQDPERSRILRAPLARGGPGFGQALCRDRKVDPRRQRIHLLWKGYAHAVQPPESFPRREEAPVDESAPAVTPFASTDDPHYRAMLETIRDARLLALADPRIDMPGAVPLAGTCRMFYAPAPPREAPRLAAALGDDGAVVLRWEGSARTIGLNAEVYRGDHARFDPQEGTRLTSTPRFEYVDYLAPTGEQHYALVFVGPEGRSPAGYARVTVPPPAAPPSPQGLEVLPASCSVRLRWRAVEGAAGYHVYRSHQSTEEPMRITEEPVAATDFADARVEHGVPYTYAVRAVSRRGAESAPSEPVETVAQVILAPMFALQQGAQPAATLHPNETLRGKRHGQAAWNAGRIDCRQGGHVTFPHRPAFDLTQPLSVAFWVCFDKQGNMPVVVGCGHWRTAGWFVQWLGNRWRWHVGGVDCDGGQPDTGRWMHVAGTYDGRVVRLYEDGRPVAETAGAVQGAIWPGDLHVGQYSGSPGPDFQVHGRIAGVAIYHRALAPDEVAAAAQTPPE